jgi:hypothetical protein
MVRIDSKDLSRKAEDNFTSSVCCCPIYFDLAQPVFQTHTLQGTRSQCQKPI